jgi:hypothetical protein
MNDEVTPVVEDAVLGGDERTPFSGVSIADLIREEAQELADSKETFIPIVGYEKTGLRAKYVLPESGKELDAIARKVNKEQTGQYDRNLYTAIDTMIHLCVGLYVQPEDVEEPVMLDPEETGEPARFDAYLSSILQMPEGQSTARQAVKRLFGGNEQAILVHTEKLSRWLNNTKADLSLEIWQVMTGEA